MFYQYIFEHPNYSIQIICGERETILAGLSKIRNNAASINYRIFNIIGISAGKD